MENQPTVAGTKRQKIEELVAKKDYREAVVECEELEILVRNSTLVTPLFTTEEAQEAPALIAWSCSV